jgi:hypothetical protein
VCTLCVRVSLPSEKGCFIASLVVLVITRLLPCTMLLNHYPTKLRSLLAKCAGVVGSSSRMIFAPRQ